MTKWTKLYTAIAFGSLITNGWLTAGFHDLEMDGFVYFYGALTVVSAACFIWLLIVWVGHVLGQQADCFDEIFDDGLGDNTIVYSDDLDAHKLAHQQKA